MNVRIQLHGALREAAPSGFVEIDLPAGSRIATLRQHLATWLAQHAPAVDAGLLRRSAFATEEEILHDEREIPPNTQLAVLPPVSGG